MRSGSFKVFKAIEKVVLGFWILFGVGLVSTFLERQYVYPLSYRDEILFYSKRYDVPPSLVFSMARTESGFRADAKSSAGAIGVMQLMPNTASFVAEAIGVENYDLTDAETNIEFGTFYLKYLTERFESVDVAVCAYNAGEGNVWLWLHDPETSTDGKTLTSIPYKETREHLKKVKSTQKKYLKLYAQILDK